MTGFAHDNCNCSKSNVSYSSTHLLDAGILPSGELPHKTCLKLPCGPINAWKESKTTNCGDIRMMCSLEGLLQLSATSFLPPALAIYYLQVAQHSWLWLSPTPP